MLYMLPIDTLTAFLEATAAHPGQPMAGVAAFAGFSDSTAQKALGSLRGLGLVERDGSCWRCTAADIERGVSEETARAVLRRALHNYRCFELVCEGLVLGESIETAARKAAVLDPESKAKDYEILFRWAVDLGIFEQAESGLALAEDLGSGSRPPAVLGMQEVVSEATARLFTARVLGREAHHRLDETDRQLLASAIMLHRTRPREAAEHAGQAVEDFLRELSVERGFTAEATKCNGAMQLSSMLVSKGVLHSHLQKLVEAASTVRNAKAHRKDKRTLAPWTITEFGALSTAMTALTAIRAINAYVYEGKQEL
jgi:hypothetical protein